ncbi:relaxase domain-containing protein [Pirellulales bacterium]|nr:relaxase domain-containing protein [Pirellulales bacterium]
MTSVLFFIAMISMAALGVSGYHALVAQQDYFNANQPGERPGFFVGRGFRLLGGDDPTVSAPWHRSLLRGLDPIAGTDLRKTAGRRTKDAGWDIVVSAPKSVSAAFGLTAEPAERKKMLNAFLASLAPTVQRIENTTFIRVGAKGRPVPALPLISCWIHTSARPTGSGQCGDPHLHAHLVVYNAAITEDGRTGALLSRPLFVRKMMWGGLARCDQAEAIRAEFPTIQYRQTATGFEIEGFPDSVLRHFSKRRRAIEAELPHLEKQSAAAKQFACLKTRQPKRAALSLNELAREWRAQAQALGFDFRKISGLLTHDRPSKPVDKPTVLNGAFDRAVKRATEKHSHFSEFDLIRYTADATCALGVWGRDVEQHVTLKVEQSERIVYLGRLRGQKRYSTPAILAEEQMLLASADQLAQRKSHQITSVKIAARLSLANAAAVHRWWTLHRDSQLSADGRQAVRSVAADSGQLALVTAATGTGKLEALSRLAQFYGAAGYSVVSVAPSLRSARPLAERAETAGMALTTLLEFADRDRSLAAGAKHTAKQLVREVAGRRIGLFPYQRKAILSPNTVIMVDQAERISTCEMARLLKHVDQSGAKLVLSGNVDGLQSIDRGVPFSSLARALPAARLTEVVQSRKPEEVKNIKRLREGEAKELLEDLGQRGHLHVTHSRAVAARELIADWRRAGGTRKPAEHLILVSDPQEAKRVNDLASQASREDQENSNARFSTSSIILRGGEKISCGDRIRCTQTSRRYLVQSGSLGTVLAVSRRLNSLQVQLDGGEQTTLPLDAYPHVTRGYAVTAWQAAPAQHVYLLLGSSHEDRQAALVKFSQGTKSTRAYVDRLNAGPQLREITRQLALDRQKSLAVDVQRPQPEPERRS